MFKACSKTKLRRSRQAIAMAGENQDTRYIQREGSGSLLKYTTKRHHVKTRFHNMYSLLSPAISFIPLSRSQFPFEFPVRKFVSPVVNNYPEFNRLIIANVLSEHAIKNTRQEIERGYSVNFRTSEYVSEYSAIEIFVAR